MVADIQTQTIATIKEAMLRFSKTENIPVGELRLKIQVIDGEMAYRLMRKTEILKAVTLKEVLHLGFDFMGIKEGIVKSALHASITKLSNALGIGMPFINARMVVRSPDAEPQCYLYDAGECKKEILLNDLIN